jgi:alpha-D-xyloside xylohydrolase
VHTTVLAAVLLLVAAERVAHGHTWVAVIAALTAATAREDAAVAVAGFGCAVALGGRWRAGGVIAGLGAAWAALCILVILPTYSGGGGSPFVVRYGALLGGPDSMLEALQQPVVREYLTTIVMSGGWLSAFAPVAMAPAIPLLALNVFSSSPWMASGKAHYSVLVLPFVVIGAASALRHLNRMPQYGGTRVWVPNVVGLIAIASGVTSYVQSGSGPYGGNASPAQVTTHSSFARSVAASIPEDARVSVSASLFPQISQRQSVYVFPAIEDAEFVLLDLTVSPAPTSAGDVFLRVKTLLSNGEWVVRTARDGVLLLHRREADAAQPSDCREPGCLPEELLSFLRLGPAPAGAKPVQSFLYGTLDLLSAEVLPSPQGDVEPDGPRGILRTVWRANTPLPDWASPSFQVKLNNGSSFEAWDLAPIWWYRPERWIPGEQIQIDVPGIPLRQLSGWAAQITTPAPQRLPLGDLSLEVKADPWQMRLLAPTGATLWEEAPGAGAGYQASSGEWHHARVLRSVRPLAEGGFRITAGSDDPGGRSIVIEARALTPRSARFTVIPGPGSEVRAVREEFITPADERFVGFGERFTGINQRGKLVDVWAEDRVLAGHGESTYAAIPLLLSSYGHSVLLERSEWAQFDLAASQPDRWAWTQRAEQASVVVSYGPGLKDLVQRHAEITGLPPLPPIWAFGVIKTVTGGQEKVLAEVRRLRELEIPVSAVYAYDTVDHEANIGWPYVNYAGRSAGRYPDPAKFTAELHRQGIKALTYFKADFHLDRHGWETPMERGFLVKGSNGGPLVHDRFPVTWLDFTNTGAVTWWKNLWQRALVDLGFDGGMLDVGEMLPASAILADGSSGLQTHNRYPLLYAQHAWEHASSLRPDGDFLLFARSGFAGAQKYQSLQWPGDPTMQWEAPAGLRSLVPAALSFGLSGFPYWHPEVGGYIQQNLPREEERELWLRWLQLATWTSTLRDQYGDYPTAPMDMWLDERNTKAFREAAEIHSALAPYLYSLAIEASTTGVPLMRFMPLEAEDDPRAWVEEHSYFLGHDLLVAPVVEPGATTRTVYLPKGSWVDFWTDELFEGGRDVTVPAPLNGGRAPVFIRAGCHHPARASL